MKKNNKGFMLTEILIVVTVIVTSMLFLYVQISNVSRNYDETFKYNTVNGIYAAENLREFLLNDNIDMIVSNLETHDYVDLSDCNNEYILNTSYCIMLYDNLNVKKLYFTNQDVSNLDDANISLEVKKFIKTIDYDNSSAYRLIVEYNDKTYTSIKMEV